MKITYLVNQAQPDGTERLGVVTRADWLTVLEINKLLPLDQRRYFIRDCIREHGELD